MYHQDSFGPQHPIVSDIKHTGIVFWFPLTIHLKSVGLKKLLISICVTRIVAHVGCSHLGDVQRTIIAEILLEKERQTLITQRKIW